MRRHAQVVPGDTAEPFRSVSLVAPLAAAHERRCGHVTANLQVKGLAVESACTTDANMMAKMASIARSMDADAACAAARR